MTSINLFFASWCKYCKDFQPIWNNVKEWCNKNGIEANEYEGSQNQTQNGIPPEMIGGFPTIIIKCGADKFTKVIDKSYDKIIAELNQLNQKIAETPVVQKGGSCEGEICDSKKQQMNHFGEMSCSGNSCTIKNQTGGGIVHSKIVHSADFYKTKYLIYKNKYLTLKQNLHL